MESEKKEKKQYPLNLPRTDFPIRPNQKEEDIKLLSWWETEQLNQKAFYKNKGFESFIVHDGPPYANGHLHLGHALNKILKDIIAKYKRMSGYHVPFTPGFDCHGLPIELSVTKEHSHLHDAELIKQCRETAAHWIRVQTEEFKNIGIVADWAHPYKTMDYSYEAETMRAFATILLKGYISRKEKTVPWCAHCQTVLAAAEIEYEEKKDPSLFVSFQLTPESAQKIYAVEQPLAILVWTTTPWTLPLNQAVIAKPDAEYALVELENSFFIMGASRVQAIAALKNTAYSIIKCFSSQELVRHNVRVINPLFYKEVSIILDQSVDVSDGTAFVHCAPGAGPEDYDIGIQHNIPIYSPMSEQGTFTDKAPMPELIGKTIQEANSYVLKVMKENNTLFHVSTIAHSFPHCWRCHSPLLFRATKQWFCDLSHNNLKQQALDVIEQLTMIPESGKNRLLATVEGRLEWCLSRQRTWGVPIVALICASCDYVYTNYAFITRIADKVAEEGIEYWRALSVTELPEYHDACPQCSKKAWRKELDILDVWFDSGVSAFVVLKHNTHLSYPADLYLEGKDQHRGWFQSSLLLSIALSEDQQACMKSIVTHGFTVDEKGRKMSKSLGNVISPEQMIERISRDGLRFWVSSIDYTYDAVVSEKIFVTISEVFRKIRNTSRFLLSNLYDFDVQKNALDYKNLTLIDQYALRDVLEMYYDALLAYESYNFTKVFRLVSDFCATTLSALYLDIIKDRLYVEQAESDKRRSAQTVCFIVLDVLTKLMAPIMSFTAEKVYSFYKKDDESIHVQNLPILKDLLSFFAARYPKLSLTKQQHPKLDHIHAIKDMMPLLAGILESFSEYQDLSFLKVLRSAILKKIEEQREKGLIKHSLEAKIALYIDTESFKEDHKKSFFLFTSLCDTTEKQETFFKEFLIVSECSIKDTHENLEDTDISGLFVFVTRAAGIKCPRCWHWTHTTHFEGLCDRCLGILESN